MFRRKKSGKLSANARQGSSLVIVICVSAFLVAFALAMIYTAGALLSRSNRRLEQERSYQLARSFSEVLGAELARYQYLSNGLQPTTETPGYDGDVIAPYPGDSFYQYVVKFLEGDYGEFDPDHPDETIFHYTAGAASGGADTEQYGEIQVALYKDPEETGEMSGTFLVSEGTAKIEETPIQRYTFRIKVTATLDGKAFSYETKYRQMVSYKVSYWYQDQTVVEANDGWHQGSVTGPLYNFDGSEILQYRYTPGIENIKSCKFENAFEGEGDSV